MAGWISVVSDAMNRANTYWDKAKYPVERALGIQDPLRILPYRGYGTLEWIYIKGRVLQSEGIAPRAEDAGILKNLLNMYRRFETDEVPYAQVEIRVGDQQQAVEANEEGFFETELTMEPPIEADSLWQTVDLKLLAPPAPKQSSVTAIGEVITVRETAQFGVISDIDDTIVYTAANNLFKMIRIAYFGNERSRRLFDGVASFYQSLQQGLGNEDNPIFYVSSSAWY
ncbi:MAG: phosphatase domain-containing protein, partial [Phormidesmis sp.]